MPAAFAAERNLYNSINSRFLVMAIFDKSFVEIFSSQAVSISGGLIAGTILALYADQLLMLPGMLILLVGFLEMRGNINGSFAARLSSGLFLKVIDPENYKTKIIDGNLIASFILTFIIAIALGVITFFFNLLVFNIYTPQIIAVSIIAVVLANLIELPLTLYTTFYLFKKGHDPNNIMGPFVTSTGDIIGTISLLIAIFFVL